MSGATAVLANHAWEAVMAAGATAVGGGGLYQYVLRPDAETDGPVRFCVVFDLGFRALQ